MKRSRWLAYMTGLITGRLYELSDCTISYDGDTEGPFHYFHLKTRLGRTFKVTVEEIESPEPDKA